MQRSTRRVLAAAGLAALSTFAACETTTDAPAIAITLSSTTITLSQGANQTVTVSIARTNFTEPVALTVEGLPTGVTGTFDPASVPDGTQSSTLTLAANATATPGTATLTVKANGTGIQEQTATIALTVNVTGSYSLSMTPTSVSVALGQTATATVNVNRVSNFAQAVALTVSGAPTGMTATVNPTSATGNSSTLTIGAGNAATGTHTLTITGASPGTTNQTTTIAVTVVTATAVTLNFCSDAIPIWFAYQNEGGAWTRATLSGSSVTFNATAKVAIATVDQFATNDFSTFILHTTTSEMSALNGAPCVEVFGTKTLNGSVANVTGSQNAFISMANSFAFAFESQTTFSLTNLPNGALDLFATRATFSGNSSTPDKVIIRRGVNMTSGATMPVLDFNASEAVTPTTNTLSVTGLAGGETLDIFGALQTSAGTFGQIFFADQASTTLYSVPTGSLATGDMHFLDMFASTSSSDRSIIHFYRSGANKTFALPAALNTPTITVASSSPYVRLRGQLASQTDYPSAVAFNYFQDAAARQVQVIITAGYVGSTPTTWDVTIPDFSGAAGFDANWMLKTGQTTEWEVGAVSGTVATQLGAPPADGETIKSADRFSTIMTSRQGSIGGPKRAKPRLGLVDKPVFGPHAPR